MEYQGFTAGERRAYQEMRQKPTPRDTFFSLRNETQTFRPTSVATEFVDSDFEDDEILTDGENSPRASLQSSGQPSFTTLSSYEEATTPRSSRSKEEQWYRPIQGPRGPHLFRSSMDPSFIAPSFSHDDDDIILTLSPITPKAGRGIPESFVKTQLPPMPTRATPFQYTKHDFETTDLAEWAPEMVAQSMLSAGIELQVAERFIENDINGAILITLKFEDLRELDIHSFGIRTKVWHQIQALKDNPPASPRAPTPIEEAPSKDVRKEIRDCQGMARKPSSRRNPRRKPSATDVITPAESVSIIGIEQVVPKPHSCSKGENCSKWRKQQRVIDDFRRLNPHINLDVGGTVLIAGNAGNPETAKAIDPSQAYRPVSDAVPSVVASSDIMGTEGLPPLQYLKEATLRNMRLQDPQDNVRQFLDFQHAQGSSAANEWPPTPPFQLNPEPQSPQQRLNSLPKLTIPHIPGGLPASPRANKASRFSPHSRSSTAPSITTPVSSEQAPSEPEWAPYRMSRADPLSPDLDSNRNPNPYRFGTPFSEMDVPVTSVPLGPVARDASQSVPPEMQYQTPTGRPNPTRTQSRASARRPSVPVLPSLDENKPVRVVSQAPRSRMSAQSGSASPPRPARSHGPPVSMKAPPRAAYPWSQDISQKWQAAGAAAPVAPVEAASISSQSSTTLDNGISFEGPMKKRKQRMLRNEWHDGYFTIKGSRLNMHKNLEERDRSTLEYIDIDDYAIACSSLASTSKLSAAFRAVNFGKDKDRSEKVGAFAFQLVPQDKNTARLKKRESTLPTGGIPPEGVNGTGKTHHFAVHNRDERIDWMRELMLAKAMKQKGSEGFECHRNGNFI